MKTITIDWLERNHACADQVAICRQEWGEEIPLTTANVHRAADLGLDLGWFALHYLTASAWNAYEEAVAPALKAYEEAKAPAWAAYQDAVASALKAYEEARTSAWKAYEEAVAPALKAYEEATASALIRALGIGINPR